MRLWSDLPNYGYCIFKHNSNDLGTLKANFQISPNRIIIIYKNTGEYSSPSDLLIKTSIKDYKVKKS